MVELVILIVSLGGIGNRARQRGMSAAAVNTVAAVGWIAFFFGGASIGPASFLFRWMWVVGVYVFVEMSNGGASIGESWQCPDCRLFNDSGTLICLCGYKHPEAPR